MASQKFTGSWMHDGMLGDMSSWLKAENVGMVNRGVLWAAGYGKGRVQLHLTVDGDTVYNKSETDEFNQFRFKFITDGKQHDFVFTEGAPFIQFRNMYCEASVSDDGAIVASLFHKEGGARHSTTKRHVSEDGQRLTTDIILFKGNSEISVQLFHVRQEANAMSIEDCRAWCPNVRLEAPEDAPKDIAPDKMAVTVGLLENMFASREELVDLMIAGTKVLDDKGEDKLALEETSATEFQIVLTKQSGEVEVFAHTWQRDVGHGTVKYTNLKSGKVVATWNFRVLEGPLRVQCWEDINDAYTAVVASMSEVQSMIDRALKQKRVQN